jgi:hypothetical protein
MLNQIGIRHHYSMVAMRKADGKLRRLSRNRLADLQAKSAITPSRDAPVAILSPGDILPGLFCFLNRRHWSHAAEEHHTPLAAEILGDIVWDETPLPDLTASDS